MYYINTTYILLYDITLYLLYEIDFLIYVYFVLRKSQMNYLTAVWCNLSFTCLSFTWVVSARMHVIQRNIWHTLLSWHAPGYMFMLIIYTWFQLFSTGLASLLSSSKYSTFFKAGNGVHDARDIVICDLM